MKSKTIIAIYVLIAIILAYFAYPIVKERYFQPESNEHPESIDQEKMTEEDFADDSEINKDESDFRGAEENGQEDEKLDTKAEEDEALISIKSEDCKNNCEKFKNDATDFEYCRQVCGFSILRQDANGCADLEGLETDYCYKDLAISKKDFKICDQISDKGVKKTCITRVTEEFFDGE